jgi:hypothetical protein
MCLPGMRLENEKTSQHDLRGNVTSVSLSCVGDGKEVDVTGWIMAMMIGLPILGGGLMCVWAVLGHRRAVRSALLDLEQGQKGAP